MNTNRDNDRELWRRLAPRAPSEPSPPEANLLAAWLDGAATFEETERVDRALAADPSLLDAVAELRALRADEADAPPAVIERARARMPQARPRTAERTFFLHSSAWRAVAALVAVLVTAPGAYRLGRVTARGSSRVAMPSEVRDVFSQDDAGADVAGLLDRARKGGQRS